MDEEIQQELKECNDIMYYDFEEKQAKEARQKVEDRLLDILEERYADQLPIDGGFTNIIIGKYEVLVSNHRNKYNSILYVDDVDEPPNPVTLARTIAEGAPSWAIAAATVLEPKQKEE